eukprot:6725319-Prymnesium_polylepis.1
MGVYTKIDPVGDHVEMYAMNEGHDGKVLFRKTFAPRSDGGTGEATENITMHWAIGMLRQNYSSFHEVPSVHVLTVEILGPAVTSGPCGDLIQAHSFEGWKFLDEGKATADDAAGSQLDASAVMETEYATRVIGMSCVGATSVVGDEACCVEGVRLSMRNTSEIAEAQTASMRHEESESRAELWHNVPETSDE